MALFAHTVGYPNRIKTSLRPSFFPLFGKKKLEHFNREDPEAFGVVEGVVGLYQFRNHKDLCTALDLNFPDNVTKTTENNRK